MLKLSDSLVSWGEDGAVRFWSLAGEPSGSAWIAPTNVEMVDTINDDLWVGLSGRPHRLLFDEPD